jgi:hypothetical protein
MVFRNTHEELLETMEQFRLPIQKMKEEAREILDGKPNGLDILENTVIRPVIFSDSVLLFSNDDSLASSVNIIYGVQSVISHALLEGIPIKGAIAYGEQTAHFSSSLYFGKPLIDAWELQNEVVIYGVVLHHTMERHLIGNGWMKELDGKSILKYPTPLKQGTITHYFVDWLASPMKTSELKNSLPDLYGTVSGSARQYVDNTMSFVNWKEKQNTKLLIQRGKGIKK